MKATKQGHRWSGLDHFVPRIVPNGLVVTNSGLTFVTDEVERSLFNQAMSEKSFLATIAWLKSHRDTYRDKLQVDVTELKREIEQHLLDINRSARDSLPEAMTGKVVDEALVEVVDETRQLGPINRAKLI